jgi:hypothetical protein
MYEILLNNRDVNIEAERDLIKAKSYSFIPEDYRKFLMASNGGYFFKSSLHLFGLSEEHPYHDILSLNTFIQDTYKDLASDLVFFGEDLFGNLFAVNNKDYLFFNIETAERKVLASSFAEWEQVINSDIDYFTGRRLVPNDPSKEKLSEGYRYCVKMPIILGGDYNHNNLTVRKADENLKFNASIAQQVHDLPDGTKFEIKFK